VYGDSKMLPPTPGVYVGVGMGVGGRGEAGERAIMRSMRSRNGKPGDPPHNKWCPEDGQNFHSNSWCVVPR
jgi:hypothetical protein